jgi:hypothetical protein
MSEIRGEPSESRVQDTEESPLAGSSVTSIPGTLRLIRYIAGALQDRASVGLRSRGFAIPAAI